MPQNLPVYIRAVTAYAMPIAQQDATSVVGRRIGAWFIDLLIYLALATLINLAFLGGSDNVKQLDLGPGDHADYCSARVDQNGYCFVNNDTAVIVKSPGNGLIIIAGHMVLYALIQGLAGGSLGKLAVGLRVVDSEGQLCGVGRSFVRTVLWIGDAITCGLPILGGILMLSTKGHRRLGDMAAGTYVVPKEAVGHPVAIPGVTAPMTAGYGPTSQPSYPPYQPGPSQPGPDQAGDPNGPRWDTARNAYIQWDAGQNHWLQYDDGAKEWKKIET